MGPARESGAPPLYELIVVFPGRAPLTLSADAVAWTLEAFLQMFGKLPPGGSVLYVPFEEAEAITISRRG